MRKRILIWSVGVLVVSAVGLELCSSPAVAAGTNDHFANRRRAAEQQRQAARRPWGGPTTGRNWWTPSIERRHRVIVPGGTYFFPGYYSPHYPSYGYPSYGYPYYQTPFYAPPVYWPGHRIHIEHRLRLP